MRHLWVSLFILFSSTSHAQFDVAALKAAFSSAFVNNGPNCYNTTLIALGYISDRIHISPLEAELYLARFCIEIDQDPLSAPNGLVITYRSRTDARLEHIAALVGAGQVFEKYNYVGTGGQSHPNDYQAYYGAYLFHPLANSSYYQETDEFIYQVLSCAPATTVHKFLTPIHQQSWAQKLLQLRNRLAHDIATVSPAKLGAFFRRPAVKYIEELSQLLEAPTRDPFEQEYKLALITSSYRQIHFLLEDSHSHCPSCTDNDSDELRSALKKIKGQLSQ